jgi:hypothetical protein
MRRIDMIELIFIALAATLVLLHFVFRALGNLLAASNAGAGAHLAGPRAAYAARWSSDRPVNG